MKPTPVVVALVLLILGIAHAHISRSPDGVDNSIGGGKSLAHLLLSPPVRSHKDVADDHRASFLIPAADSLAIKAQHFAGESSPLFEEGAIDDDHYERRRRRDADNVAVPITIANASKSLSSSAIVNVAEDKTRPAASPPRGPVSADGKAQPAQEPSAPKGPKRGREKLIGKEQPKPKIHAAPQDGNAKPEKSAGRHAHEAGTNQPAPVNKVSGENERTEDGKSAPKAGANQHAPGNKVQISGETGKVEVARASTPQAGTRVRRAPYPASPLDKQKKAGKDEKTKKIKSHGQ